MHRNDHDLSVGNLYAYIFSSRNAIKIRQVDIHQDHIWLNFHRHVNPLCAAAGSPNQFYLSIKLQQFAEILARFGVIIYYEYTGFFFGNHDLQNLFGHILFIAVEGIRFAKWGIPAS